MTPKTRVEQLLALIPPDEVGNCLQWVIDHFDELHNLYNRDLSGVYAKWRESLLLRLPEGM